MWKEELERGWLDGCTEEGHGQTVSTRLCLRGCGRVKGQKRSSRKQPSIVVSLLKEEPEQGEEDCWGGGSTRGEVAKV